MWYEGRTQIQKGKRKRRRQTGLVESNEKRPTHFEASMCTLSFYFLLSHRQMRISNFSNPRPTTNHFRHLLFGLRPSHVE